MFNSFFHICYSVFFCVPADHFNIYNIFCYNERSQFVQGVSHGDYATLRLHSSLQNERPSGAEGLFSRLKTCLNPRTQIFSKKMQSCMIFQFWTILIGLWVFSPCWGFHETSQTLRAREMNGMKKASGRCETSWGWAALPGIQANRSGNIPGKFFEVRF